MEIKFNDLMKFGENEEFQRDSEDKSFIINNNINRKFERDRKEENYNKKVADKVTCNSNTGSITSLKVWTKSTSWNPNVCLSLISMLFLLSEIIIVYCRF